MPNVSPKHPLRHSLKNVHTRPVLFNLFFICPLLVIRSFGRMVSIQSTSVSASFWKLRNDVVFIAQSSFGPLLLSSCLSFFAGIFYASQTLAHTLLPLGHLPPPTPTSECPPPLLHPTLKHLSCQSFQSTHHPTSIIDVDGYPPFIISLRRASSGECYHVAI